MGFVAMGQSDALPEFQKYLLEKKLVPSKNEPFFAYWASLRALRCHYFSTRR